MPRSNNDPLHVESELLQTGGTPSSASHVWKQRGPYLVCGGPGKRNEGCAREHAIGIMALGATSPTDVFQGFGEDGKARFKSIG